MATIRRGPLISPTPPARRNPPDWSNSFALSQQQRMPPGRGMTQQELPPRAAPRAVTLLTHTDSFKLPLQQRLPAGKIEQPQIPPTSQRRNLADWQDYILPWAQAPPLRQNDWPNPRGSRPLVQDWIEPGNALLPAAQVQQPFAQTVWPVPPAPARLIALGYTDSFKLPLQQVIQPNQYDWPNPRAPKPLVVDWQETFQLPLQQVIQPNQYDWPNPRGPRAPVQDWTNFALPVAPAATQLPFSQTDWPVPKTKAGVLQTWSDSFKLPLQQVLPPRQLDWPNPRGPVSYDLRGYTQRSVIIPPVVVLPRSQRDWPNPRGALQPVVTARDFIHGVVPPAPPVFDSERTLKNEIIRLRYLDNISSRVRFLKNEVRS